MATGEFVVAHFTSETETPTLVAIESHEALES
jgi:hypothetical protein